MKKRTLSRFSVSHVPKLNPYSLKKVNLKNSEITKIQNQVNPAVAKWTFVTLMILIFFALSFKSPSFTSYSIVDTPSVNPSLNLVIFFGLLALVFFLTYEKRNQSKKPKK